MRTTSAAEISTLAHLYGAQVCRDAHVHGQHLELTSYEDTHVVTVCNEHDELIAAELSYSEAEACSRWMELIGARAMEHCRACKC